MSAQTAVQPSVTVRNNTQIPTVRVILKPEQPMMREPAKAKPQVEQPVYDFVGIAG